MPFQRRTAVAVAALSFAIAIAACSDAPTNQTRGLKPTSTSQRQWDYGDGEYACDLWITPSSATLPHGQYDTLTAYENYCQIVGGVYTRVYTKTNVQSPVTWSSSSSSLVSIGTLDAATQLQVIGESDAGTDTITAQDCGGLGSCGGAPRLTATSVITLAPGLLGVYITGPSQLTRYQSGQYYANTSGGTPPYTYQWRARDGWGSTFGSWQSWYSSGSTNYTYTSVSACGINHRQLETMVTDAAAGTSTYTYDIYITNPC